MKIKWRWVLTRFGLLVVNISGFVMAALAFSEEDLQRMSGISGARLDGADYHWSLAMVVIIAFMLDRIERIFNALWPPLDSSPCAFCPHLEATAPAGADTH